MLNFKQVEVITLSRALNEMLQIRELTNKDFSKSKCVFQL